MTFNDLRATFPDCDLHDHLEAAASRLEIDAKDPQRWIGSPCDLLEWLDEHPKATANVGNWCLLVSSPDAADLIGLERFNPPSELITAVEEFWAENAGDCFNASWAFA
jgi:hypothetical protein